MPVILRIIIINPLKMKRRLLYLKPQFVPRSKQFKLSYKNQSVYGVSGTSCCLFSDKYEKTYSVGRAYRSWMLNWLVYHVTSRLWRLTKVFVRRVSSFYVSYSLNSQHWKYIHIYVNKSLYDSMSGYLSICRSWLWKENENHFSLRERYNVVAISRAYYLYITI